jgi:flagellar motility protein MotE (MotC chaperone)
MDKFLGQDCKNSMERIEFLETNCFGKEEKGYMKQFTPEEVAQMKDELAEASITINEIEIEKKAIIDSFKDRLKPLEEQRKQLLKGLKEKAEFVKEQCFKFIYEDERMVGFFNEDGVLVEARPIRPEDGQLDMFFPMKKTGTNN